MHRQTYNILLGELNDQKIIVKETDVLEPNGTTIILEKIKKYHIL